MPHSNQIPSETIRKWQEIVDLLAKIMRVPCAMVRRVDPPNIKVLVSSTSKGNPYEPVAPLNTGLYCETVVKTRQLMLVQDARQDERWRSSPEIKLSMISYLGAPISWPDGEIFGTICVLDDKSNEYSELCRRLLLQWRDVLQDDLRMLATLHPQLEEREAKIRRLVEANIIGIFIWDFDGHILEANDAFLRMVGYDREDLVSGLVRWTDLTPPEWLDRDVRQWLPKLKTTGSLQPIEKEYFRKDGSRVPVLIGAAQFDEMGNEGVAFVLDLTERKRAEEALRESEEQWKAVFENNPTMFFMLDATGTILSVNPLGAEQLGYTVDELIGRSVQILFHQADREAAQRNTALCLQQLGRALTWELRKIRKNGEMLWVRETAKAMLIKNRPIVLIVCDDITERKRAEYLTSQVFESSPDGISVLGRDYRYQRVNPVYERTWGIPAEKIIGKHVADLLGNELFEETIKPNLDRCFKGEEIRYAEWFPSALGRRYLAATYSPLRPNAERVEAVLVVTHDLTDHVLASEALRTAQAELAHVNRITTMGQLTASIAHEVNQPIAAAITNAQAASRWLGAQPPDLDEVRQALSRIVENGKRASDVIGRIRALIKKAPPRRRRFDLNEAVLDIIALTRSEVLRHGVSLQTQLATGLPLVEGDRIQLQQVLLNLIMNAVEAMSGVDQGGRELQISTEAESAGGVLVTVRDSGPGLDPANVDRLFEAFYTTKPEGMGMGLAISRSIIEAHGGRMWATANEPRGAVFQFTVPPERDETIPAEDASQTPVV